MVNPKIRHWLKDRMFGQPKEKKSVWKLLTNKIEEEKRRSVLVEP